MTEEEAGPQCQQEGGGSVEACSAGSCGEGRVSDGTAPSRPAATQPPFGLSPRARKVRRRATLDHGQIRERPTDEARRLFVRILRTVRDEWDQLKDSNLGVRSGSEVVHQVLLADLDLLVRRLHVLCTAHESCSLHVSQLCRKLPHAELERLKTVLDVLGNTILSDFLHLSVYNTTDLQQRTPLGADATWQELAAPKATIPFSGAALRTGDSQEKQYRRILLLEHEPAAPDEPMEDGHVTLQPPSSATSGSPAPGTAGSTRNGRKRRAVSFDHPLLVRARQLGAERAALIDECAAGSSEAEPEEGVPQPLLEQQRTSAGAAALPLSPGLAQYQRAQAYRRFSRVEACFSSPRSTGSIVSQAAADTSAAVTPRSPTIRHWSIPCSPADSHRLPSTNSRCSAPSTLPSLGNRLRESAVAIARRPPTDDKMLLLPPLAVRLVNTSAKKASEEAPPNTKRTSPGRMSGSAGHGLRPSRDLSGQETPLESRMHSPHAAAACTL